MSRYPISIERLQRGESIVEVLVAMLALVPVFIILPYIGKYLDVKDKTIAGSRYLSWERSVYSDPGASWGADENSVDDTRLSTDMAIRLLGDPRQPIVTRDDDATGQLTRNPLWVDYKHDNLVSLAAFGLPDDDPDNTGNNVAVAAAGATLDENQAPIFHGVSVEALAFGGAGLDGLGLNDRGFVDGAVRLPMLPIPGFERNGVGIDIQPPGAGATRLLMPGESALFTDPWVPGSEDNFVGRIDGLVTDEILQLLVAPGTFTFGNTLLFNEGRKGQDPQLESNTTVLPEELVQ